MIEPKNYYMQKMEEIYRRFSLKEKYTNFSIQDYKEYVGINNPSKPTYNFFSEIIKQTWEEIYAINNTREIALGLLGCDSGIEVDKYMLISLALNIQNKRELNSIEINYLKKNLLSLDIKEVSKIIDFLNNNPYTSRYNGKRIRRLNIEDIEYQQSLFKLLDEKEIQNDRDCLLNTEKLLLDHINASALPAGGVYF